MSDITVVVGPWSDSVLQAAARAIRIAVFLDEQQVPPEMEFEDDEDDHIHCVAFRDSDRKVALGTARLHPVTGKIGRMSVMKEARGRGVGTLMLNEMISVAMTRGVLKEVKLSSQIHAIEFYARTGFVPHGDRFMEAGIEHIEMTKSIV